MKSIYKFLSAALFVGAAAGLQSCDLEEYNPSAEGADEVLATEQGIEGLVNQMYYNFRWKYFGREDPVIYMEASADLFQARGDNYEYGKNLTRYVGLQGSNCGAIASCWSRVYDNINDANAVINHLTTNIEVTDEQRADFDGEARWMRAYGYWWLTEFFGDIELRTKETQEAVFTAYRTDRKTIYDDVIIPDLEKACEELPVTPYNDNIGRSTKKAAYGLLARVCLTRAQYETAGSDSQKAFYQKALDAANYVMNNKSALGIKLYDTYDEIWQAKNNKSNTEYLMVVTHSSNAALNPQSSNPNRLHIFYTPSLIDNAGITNGAATWDYPSENTSFKGMPTYYMLNLYADWDARYDTFFQEDFTQNAKRGFTWTEEMQQRYNAPASIVGVKSKSGNTVLRFTRQHVTTAEKEEAAANGMAIVGIDDVYKTEDVTSLGGAPSRDCTGSNGVAETNQFIAASFPRFMKYRIWDGNTSGTILLTSANGTAGYADVPLMRYAEMPLIAAECYIALGNTEAAANIINSEIRTSRILKEGHSESEMKVSASDMTIEWILEERARELCGEHLRWFDLKRTGKLVEYVRGHNPSMTGDLNIQDYNTLWPIPNAFLDKLSNAQEFGQNPGYNAY